MSTTIRLWDGYEHTSPRLQPVVHSLQSKLNDHGFQTSTDGRFGWVTAENTRQFQSSVGLVPDGVVGPLTWAALEGRSLELRPLETSYLEADTSMLAQEKMARRYESWIRLAAQDAGVAPSVICGIGSRESHWGMALRPPRPEGTGDFIKRATVRPWRLGNLPPDKGGYGRGLMQIDYDAHEFARGADWRDPEKNIAYGGKVLRGTQTFIVRKVPGLSEAQVLAAGIAGYNCGAGNVRKALERGRDVDYYTHGRDYSKDVLDRSGWFQLHGWA